MVRLLCHDRASAQAVHLDSLQLAWFVGETSFNVFCSSYYQRPACITLTYLLTLYFAQKTFAGLQVIVYNPVFLDFSVVLLSFRGGAVLALVMGTLNIPKQG